MRAGQLRTRVVVEQVTETRDSLGDPVEAWTTYATRWAAVSMATGREVWSSEQKNAEAKTQFRFRYDTVMAALTTKMRLTIDSRIFDIQSINNVHHRNREIHVMAVERI